MTPPLCVHLNIPCCEHTKWHEHSLDFIIKIIIYKVCLCVKRQLWWQYSITYLKDKHEDEEQHHVNNTEHGNMGATNTNHKEHYDNHPNPEFDQQALNKVTQSFHGLICLLGSICIWKTRNTTSLSCWWLFMSIITVFYLKSHIYSNIQNFSIKSETWRM